MMMHFLLLKRNKTSRVRRVSLWKHVVFFIFVASFVFLSVRGVLVTFFSPWYEEVRVSVKDIGRGWYGLLVSKETLLRELEEVKSNLAENDAVRMRIEALEEENETLRMLAGRGGVQTVVARIRRCESTVLTSLCVLDAGVQKGIRTSMLVVSRGNMVVGLVESVDSESSRVRLLGSPFTKEMFLVHTSNGVVSFEGRGMGDGVVAGEVPRDTSLSQGDRVTLPFLEEYCVGVVEEVRGAPEDATKTILVRTFVPHESYVLVDTRSQ
jgi:cell shape-determining protein MreC